MAQRLTPAARHWAELPRLHAQLGRLRGTDQTPARSGRPNRSGSPVGPRAAVAVSVAAHAAILLVFTYVVVNSVESPAIPEEQSIALVFDAVQKPAASAVPTPQRPEPAPVPAPPDSEPVAAQPPPAPTTPPPISEAVAVPEPPPPPQPAPPQTREARLPPPVFLPETKSRTEPVTHRAPARTAPPHQASPAPMAVAPAGPAVAERIVPARPVTGMETNRAPNYPETARRRGEQGRVMLRVAVSAQGAPLEVDVAKTSGYPVLDSAALSAVRQWQFIPATQAGVPISSVADVPVHFKLEN